MLRPLRILALAAVTAYAVAVVVPCAPAAASAAPVQTQEDAEPEYRVLCPCHSTEVPRAGSPIGQWQATGSPGSDLDLPGRAPWPGAAPRSASDPNRAPDEGVPISR